MQLSVVGYFFYFACQALFVDVSFILPCSGGFTRVGGKPIGITVQWNPCPPPCGCHKWAFLTAMQGDAQRTQTGSEMHSTCSQVVVRPLRQVRSSLPFWHTQPPSSSWLKVAVCRHCLYNAPMEGALSGRAPNVIHTESAEFYALEWLSGIPCIYASSQASTVHLKTFSKGSRTFGIVKE